MFTVFVLNERETVYSAALYKYARGKKNKTFRQFRRIPHTNDAEMSMKEIL